MLAWVRVWRLKGNPVGIGDGPAAVIGDESCTEATALPLSGAGRRGR